VHPEQPFIHADEFDVPHDPLELLYVPVFVHVVYGGHGVHGMLPDQLHALLSESRTTSIDVPQEPLGLLHVPLMTVMTENKPKTNQQEQVEKCFLEPPFAVKKLTLLSPITTHSILDSTMKCLPSNRFFAIPFW
jgi:hypothetical protein